MNWLELNAPSQIEAIKNESATTPVLIFKHSTRCNISRTVLDRLERKWNLVDIDIKLYFLDLLSFRDVSACVAHAFNVEHESPQVILIKDGKALWSDSHFGIEIDSIAAAVQQL